MDLSLPVSEEISPPSNNKKRSKTTVGLSSCFSPSQSTTSPPSPSLALTKRDRKAQRLAKRKNKNKGDKGLSKSSAAVADSTPGAVDHVPTTETAVIDGHCESESVKTDSSDSIIVSGSHSRSLKTEGADTDGQTDEEDNGNENEDEEEEDAGLSESADVEDNEDQEKDMGEEIALEMKNLAISEVQEHADRTASINQTCSDEDSLAARKTRTSEWISRSLCSLAVRYQATNHVIKFDIYVYIYICLFFLMVKMSNMIYRNVRFCRASTRSLHPNC